MSLIWGLVLDVALAFGIMHFDQRNKFGNLNASLLLSPQAIELNISIALGASGPIGLLIGTDEPFTVWDSSTILRE